MASLSSLTGPGTARAVYVGGALLLIVLGARLVLLAGGPARLDLWPGHFDQLTAERYATKLETLRTRDAELSSEVLKARTGLIAHYDGLVRNERALDGLYRALREVPTFLQPADRTALRSELQAAERESASTFRLVERFKSENAVLRNSLFFLRSAASVLDQYPSNTPADREFRERASALVRDLLLLRLLEDASLLSQVGRDLSALAAYVESLPSARQTELRLLLGHARAVREHAPNVNRLVRLIIAQPALAHAGRAIALYAGLQRSALARASQSTAALLAMLLIAGALGAFTVITRMRHSALSLRRASNELEAALGALQEEQEKERELSELKTRFVAMTSHEFRTPLSTILSSSEMLCAYDELWTPAKKAVHFERIRQAVLHMTRMLEAILLIGRSDARKLEFKPGPVLIGRLCAEAAETAGKAIGDDHELRVESALDEDLVVLADETLLRHVVDNLLSNAIKYSPRGGRIAFAVRHDGDSIFFDVSDQGIGIPPRDQEHLFEVFHRGSNVGNLTGSGLGLSVVKRAVDLHGGSVTVQSEIGLGSRFVVRMPCPRSEAA